MTFVSAHCFTRVAYFFMSYVQAYVFQTLVPQLRNKLKPVDQLFWKLVLPRVKNFLQVPGTQKVPRSFSAYKPYDKHRGFTF